MNGTTDSASLIHRPPPSARADRLVAMTIPHATPTPDRPFRRNGERGERPRAFDKADRPEPSVCTQVTPAGSERNPETSQVRLRAQAPNRSCARTDDRMSEGNVSATIAPATPIGFHGESASQIDSPTTADDPALPLAIAAEDIVIKHNRHTGFPHPWHNPAGSRDADPITPTANGL